MKRSLFRLDIEIIAIAVFIGLSLLFVLLGSREESRGVFGVLRIIFTLPYLLLLPGYLYQTIMFARRDQLQPNERAAISFVISIAIMPIAATVIELLGLDLTSTTLIGSITLIVVLGLLFSYLRRRSLPPDDQFVIRAEFGVRNWWIEQSRSVRILMLIGSGAVIVFLVMAFLIVAVPGPANFFTEFRVLGSEGLARDYPRFIKVGDSVGVTLNVANNEGGTHTYTITATAAGQQTYASDPFTLASGEVRDLPIEFIWQMPGENLILQFDLYLGGGDRPYRTLILYVTSDNSD